MHKVYCNCLGDLNLDFSCQIFNFVKFSTVTNV